MGIFRCGANAFGKQALREVRLVFGKPAARIGALASNALEHVDTGLQASLLVPQFRNAGSKFGLFRPKRFNAFLANGFLLLEIFNFGAGRIHALLDIFHGTQGIVTLRTECFQFAIPAIKVRLEHVRFGIGTFKAGTERVQRIRRLQALVRKFPRPGAQVIELVAHYLQGFAFTFQDGAHLVHLGIVTERLVFLFETFLLGGKLAHLLFAAFDFVLGLRACGLGRRNGILQTNNVVVQVVEFDGRRLDFAFQFTIGVFVLADIELLFLNLGLQFGRPRLCGLDLVLHTAGRRVQRVEPFPMVLELVDTHREVQFAQALGQVLVFLDLLRLGLVLAYGTAGRTQVIFHAGHVHLHAFHLAYGFLALLAVLAHAGSLFKQYTAVVRLVAQHRLDHVGVHLRIRTGTQARVKEQGMHVAQPAFLVIYQIFARTVAMDATGNNHFRIFRGKRPIAVVDNDGNFGKAHRGTFLGTAENHVLHLAHTQEGGLLLAKHPTDGVGNVRLSTPVRAHHGGKALRGEIDFSPLRKGLESENL